MSQSRRDFLKAGSLSLAALGLGRMAMPASAASRLGFDDKNVLAGIEPLKPEDYAQRRDKAVRLLAEHGFDAIFIGGGTNLAYFTKVDWWISERAFGLILSRRKEPVWICPAFEAERAKELVPAGQKMLTWEEHEDPYALIATAFKDLGLNAGKVAAAPDLRSFEAYGLRRGLPGAEIVDGSVITQGCRGVKTAKEIAFLDAANRIIKLAYRESFKHLKSGMTVQDLAAIVSAESQKFGAPGGGGPVFGPNTAFPHGSRIQRLLQPGDPVMIDGGGLVEGYSSDVTRTVVFGKPTDRQRKVWDIVKKAQTAALKALRPGATCESVDIAARKVIEDAGFGPGYKYFAHRLGHGIGMDGHEYPYLVRGNKLKIEPGMTFSNEPGIYIYGEFGIRIEDCMVATENGGRILGGMEAVSLEQQFGAD